jgi:mRNA-degrading endonuclease RelE of RelBE toxin-antitoxin system
MPSIKIIRAAFREIQKLPLSDLQRVHEILQRLSQGNEHQTKHLQGFENLLRTRWGKWRVIWQREDGNNIVVIKAGLRGGVYDDAFEKRDRTDPLIVEELLNPQGTELAENPAYQWNHEQDTDWYEFVYGSYRYSPILTHYQRHVLDEPLKILCAQYQPLAIHKFENDSCIIIQSAPGTGKTVCATLFACEVHRTHKWNTMLIVPEALRHDIAKFSEVKQALNQENFWLGTLPQWLGKINPDLNDRLASPQQELEALQKAMKFTKQSDINNSDVLLYEAFVLDEANQVQNKNIMFQANTERLNSLFKISKKHFYKALSCRISRSDAAKILKNTLDINPGNAECTLLIVDEAQDYLLSELQAIIAVCKSWASQGHKTYLWLLGDLNQRIQPTDFTWGQLQIKNSIELLKNYRNSRQILEFANQFWDIAQEITVKNKCKDLPFPADPSQAFEIGEKVQLLECANKKEALAFLDKLAGVCGEEEKQRYLLRDLAKAVKVLSKNQLESHDNLVILDVEHAKGREFEACVAFCLFEGVGEPSLEECFQWYTLLTRARSRLLIVATSAEIQRLSTSGYDVLAKCERIPTQKAIKWISEVSSDADLSQLTDNVQQRLLKRCQTGYLYWDTYLALQFAAVDQPQVYQWEREAIKLLRKHSHTHLTSELEKIPNIPSNTNISLRCLLLRAMQSSWQAVAEATQLRDIDFKAYEYLLKSIAKDLEAKGLTYEAARVRSLIYPNNHDKNFPFWQEIANSPQPIVSLLCQAFTSRLQQTLQNHQ